jgi:small subunit ribosomal protein S6
MEEEKTVVEETPVVEETVETTEVNSDEVVYETLYAVDCSVDDETTKAVVEKFKSLIEANGSVKKFEEWGKRKLAYPINKKTEAYYALATYTADAKFIEELSRVFNITEGVMRYLTIKL